jgi:beta-lactam-binding protein with PASTA domain
VQSVPVPSVIGLDQGSAALALEEAGFYVDVRVAVSTQPPGTVIYQRPAAGTDAAQTSIVRITISEDAPTPSASPSADPAGPG